MRRVFADTVYWLALFVPGDEWSEAARSADLRDVSLVTTEEVACFRPGVQTISRRTWASAAVPGNRPRYREMT